MAPPPTTGTGQPYTGPLAINGHSPGYYLNEGVNKIVDSIPGGSGGLQQANQGTQQFANNNFRDQWTQPMTPAQATTQVAGAFGGAVLGKGLGAAGGALKQAMAAKSGIGPALSKTLAAGVQAGKQEAQSFSGIGGAANGVNPAGTNAASNGQTPANAGSAPAATTPGENPVAPASPTEPAANTTQPPPLTGAAAVQQMADEFGSDFGANAPSGAGAGTGYGNSAAPPCYAQNACFPTAVGQAQLWENAESLGSHPPGTQIQGVMPQGKPNMMMSSGQIQQQLQQRFGGATAAATNNPVYTAAERMAQQQGTPIPVTPARMSQILNSGRSGNQWLVFIKPSATGPGHVFNARYTSTGTQMWDATQKMDGSLWFSGPMHQVFLYQLF